MPPANFLRYASPNERHAIIAEDLGFYHAVVIAAVYDLGTTKSSTIGTGDAFYAPLKQCIDEHPFLSTIACNAHTEKAYYARAPTMDLAQHITVLSAVPEDASAHDAMELTIRDELDKRFTTGIPPWRLILLPLGPFSSEVLIAFSYSHGIGDGPSGIAFHHTFLSALRTSSESSPGSPTITTLPNRLGEPFDTPARLPISYSFLMRPLLGAILPAFLCSLFGLKASASADLVSPTTWTGTPCFFDPSTTHSRLIIRKIPPDALAHALRATKQREGAKLTALLEVLLARALSRALTSPSAKYDNFVCCTAINMRPSIRTPPSVMGVFANGYYLFSPRSPASMATGAPLTEGDWEQVREKTRTLAETAAKLEDQPIGLLRYAPNLRKWTKGKLGKKRDASFVLSNVGVVEPEHGDSEGEARMVNMIFAQPGLTIGAPLAFNFITVKGGELVYTVTWPSGGLGLERGEGGEEDFVKKVCEEFEAGIRAL